MNLLPLLIPLPQIQTLSKFFASQPHLYDATSEKLMASYLDCSGLLKEDNHCLEQIMCTFIVMPQDQKIEYEDVLPM